MLIFYRNILDVHVYIYIHSVCIYIYILFACLNIPMDGKHSTFHLVTGYLALVARYDKATKPSQKGQPLHLAEDLAMVFAPELPALRTVGLPIRVLMGL